MGPYLRVLKSRQRVDRHHYDRQTVKVVGGNFPQSRRAIKALSKSPLLLATAAFEATHHSPNGVSIGNYCSFGCLLNIYKLMMQFSPRILHVQSCVCALLRTYTLNVFLDHEAPSFNEMFAIDEGRFINERFCWQGVGSC